MVHFIDGRIADDVANLHPTTAAPGVPLPAETS
jgi:hypothetical protein